MIILLAYCLHNDPKRSINIDTEFLTPRSEGGVRYQA
jgi:hypothetical protein